MKSVQKDTIKNNNNISPVVISPEGIFKYIIIEAKTANQQFQYIRGDSKLEYHAQNFQKFIAQWKNAGWVIKKKNIDTGKFEAEKNNEKISFKCPGGGRIQHNYNGNKCFIYGYSKSYGKVNHKRAQTLISKYLGYELADIKTSQEGY